MILACNSKFYTEINIRKYLNAFRRITTQHLKLLHGIIPVMLVHTWNDYNGSNKLKIKGCGDLNIFCENVPLVFTHTDIITSRLGNTYVKHDDVVV
jgi:hypothetical protein